MHGATPSRHNHRLRAARSGCLRSNRAHTAVITQPRRTRRMNKIAALALASLLLTARVGAAASCEELPKLSFPNTTVTLAQSVAAGALPAPAGRGGAQASPFADLPAFCRVAATLKPSADSDIKIEVWMPASGWNGKFEAVGNGGWNGNVDQNALATALRRGYAA